MGCFWTTQMERALGLERKQNGKCRVETLLNSVREQIGHREEQLPCRVVSEETETPFLFPWSLKVAGSRSVLCKELSQGRYPHGQPEWLLRRQGLCTQE